MIKTKRLITTFIVAAVVVISTGHCEGGARSNLRDCFASLAMTKLAPGTRFNGSAEPSINKRRIVALLTEAGVPQANAGKITEDEARQVLKIISGDESTSQKQKKILAILSKYSVGKKHALELVRLAREAAPEEKTTVLARIKEKLISPQKSQVEAVAEIRQSLGKNKVVAVLGRPQIGKSSHLKNLGLYFNLEEFGMHEFATGDSSLSGLNGFIGLLAHQLNITLDESPEDFVEQVKAKIKDKTVVIDEFQVLNKDLPTAISWLRDGGARVVLIGPPSLELDSMHSSFIADLKRKGDFFIFPLPTFEEYQSVTNKIAHSALGPHVRISGDSMRRLYEISGATYVMTEIIIDHLRRKNKHPEAEIDAQIHNFDPGEIIERFLAARKEASKHYPGREEFFKRTMHGLDTSGVICHPKDDAIRKKILYTLINPAPISILDDYSDTELAVFEVLFDYGFIQYNPEGQTVMVRGALLRECAQRFYGASESAPFEGAIAAASSRIEVKFQMEQMSPAEARKNFEEMQRLKRSGKLDRLKPQKTRQHKKLSDLAVEEAGEMEVKDEHVGIAQAGGRIRYLDSGGIGPCLVVTLYDKKTKTGVMLHFLTQVFDAADNLNRTFAYLREWGVDTKNLEARIIGGDNQSDNSKYLFYKLHRFLCDTLGEERIVEIDIFSKRLEVAFLDLTDGELYDSDMPEVLRQMDAIRALSGVAPREKITATREMIFDMLPGATPVALKDEIYRKARDQKDGFASEGELEAFIRKAFDNRPRPFGQPPVSLGDPKERGRRAIASGA